MRDHRAFIIEQKFRHSPRQLRLAHAGRSQKKERANRPVRIAEPRPAAANRVRHAHQCHFLAHHALAQPLFHVHQFLDLTFQQPARGNSRPLGHNFRNLFFADFFFQHRVIFLQFRQLVLRGLQFFFRRGQLAVTDFRHLRKITGTLEALFFRLQPVNFFLLLADARNRIFLRLPAPAFKASDCSRTAQPVLFPHLLHAPFARKPVRSFHLRSACRSISSCMMRRSIASISWGRESISIRSPAAASSTRSIALSGRKRSVI